MTYIDRDAMFLDSSPPYTELWSSDLSFWENWSETLKKTVWLPDGEIQYPVATAYLLVNARLCYCLPTLFSYGNKGTGKTTIAKLAARSRKSRIPSSPHGKIRASTSTYASLRSGLDGVVWRDAPNNEQEADGPALMWDNLSPSTLLEPKLYALFLVSYQRETAMIERIGEKGELEEFLCFTSKFMSSVHPLHTNPDFDELQRRLIVIFHEECPDIEFDPLPLEIYDWRGAYEDYCTYWEDIERIKLTADAYRKVRKIRLRDLPSAFSSTRWEISRELIASMVAYEGISDINEGIEIFDKYWRFFDNRSHKDKDVVGKIITEYLEPKIAAINELNLGREASGLKPIIPGVSSEDVKKFLKAKAEEGALDFNPTLPAIKKVLQRNGYRTKKDSQKVYWVKAG